MSNTSAENYIEREFGRWTKLDDGDAVEELRGLALRACVLLRRITNSQSATATHAAIREAREFLDG